MKRIIEILYCCLLFVFAVDAQQYTATGGSGSTWWNEPIPQTAIPLLPYTPGNPYNAMDVWVTESGPTAYLYFHNGWGQWVFGKSIDDISGSPMLNQQYSGTPEGTYWAQAPWMGYTGPVHIVQSYVRVQDHNIDLGVVEMPKPKKTDRMPALRIARQKRRKAEITKETAIALVQRLVKERQDMADNFKRAMQDFEQNTYGPIDQFHPNALAAWKRMEELCELGAK